MSRQRTLGLFLLLASLGGMAPAAETVRVDCATGVPRLLVDGRPTRARIFWGAPGSRPMRVHEQWQEISFEFTPSEDEPAKATMHLRFGQIPGDIILDDMRVESLDGPPDVVPLCDFEHGIADFERDWTYWPQGAPNTVGTMQVTPGSGHDATQGLQVRLKAPPDGSWPDFHIFHHVNLALKKGQRYRVHLWARATPARDLSIGFYRPSSNYTLLGGPPSCFESQIKLAAAAGIHLVSFPLHMPWPQPGTAADWSVVDQQCETVLRANPQALLLPRMWMGPPAWWLKAHPDAVMKWDDEARHPVDAAVDSPEYLRDAAERLRALVEYLEQRFGPHIAGYHPCGQNTGEWFYHDTWGAGLNGYAPDSLRAWQKWLSDRYRTDGALQQAWQDTAATLRQVSVPSPASRRAAPTGLLRDPLQERVLIDFAEFQQEMMANCVCQLAQTVREATQGKRLVVFFYGYVHEFAAIHNGPATSGHYALRRVLQCPDIDVLCSPISYFDRGLGQSGPAMTAAESVALANKMWLVEDDTYTYLGTGVFPGWQVGAKTIEDTNKLLLRNTAQCAVRNFGTWWMDLGSAGWFDDPRMWQVMANLEVLDNALLTQPQPYRPEVAVVVDEASMLRVAAGGDGVTRPGIYEVREPLGRMGAPYGQYLLDDVIAGRVHAKLYVFVNAWCLTPQQRQDLLRATSGAVRIWCYAPGYLEPEHTAPDAMRELTGFDLRPITTDKAWATPTDRGRQLGLHGEFGVQQAITPLFAPHEVPPDEVLAVYPDGQPAVAWRDTPTGPSLFVGAPGMTAELLRLAADRANVHLYTRSDCNVYANGPFVVVHAAHDGPLVVDTGDTRPVTDYGTGTDLGPGPRITLEMAKGDTRVLVRGEPLVVPTNRQ
ncbi:MAG: beta-galactosidase [Pirellulaceae bacterium]